MNLRRRGMKKIQRGFHQLIEPTRSRRLSGLASCEVPGSTRKTQSLAPRQAAHHHPERGECPPSAAAVLVLRPACRGPLEDAEESGGGTDGVLRVGVSVTGLPPGEEVSVSAAGSYQMDWICGVAESCSELEFRDGFCPASYGDEMEGTATGTARGVAGTQSGRHW